MPGPFAGMDPFLEISGDWRDFDARFLDGCADALADQLPDNYVARIEEQFHILEFPEETEEHRLPDVSISQIRPSRVGSVDRRPISDVFSWSIRDPLPTIPVPLMAPDVDISLDLTAVFNTVLPSGSV